MNLKNRPPIFVPAEYRDEIEQLSKAALMDIAWDYAQQVAGTQHAPAVIEEFRKRRAVIELHRVERFRK